jgi:hypothetical protein
MATVTVDCSECRFEGTETCDDCLVQFVLTREAGGRVGVDVEEARAIRLLTGSGLVPALRHRRRSVGGGPSAVPA